jgi:hypothetical protein
MPTSIHVGFVMDKVALDRFFFEFFGFSSLFHYTMTLHSHISPGELKIGPMVAAVQKHSLTPST